MGDALDDCLEEICCEIEALQAKRFALAALLAKRDALLAEGWDVHAVVEDAGLVSLSISAPPAVESAPWPYVEMDGVNVVAEKDCLVLVSARDAGDDLAADMHVVSENATSESKPVQQTAPELKGSREEGAARLWTLEEDAALLEGRENGVSFAEISGRLDRSEGAARQRYRKLKSDAKVARVAGRALPAAFVEVEKRAKVAVSPGGTGPSNPAPASNRSDLRVHARLNGLEKSDVWTPERDLALVEALCAGKSLGDLQEEFGMKRAELKGRWQDLIPEPTPASQEQLLRVLRARVALLSEA